MEKIEFVPTTTNNILALVPTKENYTELKKDMSREEKEPMYSPVHPKKNIDPIFHFYLGSMSVVGLFILFRMIQKN